MRTSVSGQDSEHIFIGVRIILAQRSDPIILIVYYVAFFIHAGGHFDPTLTWNHIFSSGVTNTKMLNTRAAPSQNCLAEAVPIGTFAR